MHWHPSIALDDSLETPSIEPTKKLRSQQVEMLGAHPLPECDLRGHHRRGQDGPFRRKRSSGDGLSGVVPVRCSHCLVPFLKESSIMLECIQWTDESDQVLYLGHLAFNGQLVDHGGPV